MTVQDNNVLSPEGLPYKLVQNNSDKNDPNNVIQKAKKTEETFLNDLSTYSQTDVSAYVYIRIYKYKRGRQTLNSENPDTLNNMTELETKFGSAAVGAALAGLEIFNRNKNNIGKNGNGAIGKAVGGAIVGGVAGYVAADVLLTERTRDKADYIGTIVLPLLTPVTMNYDVNWGDFTSPARGLYEALVQKATSAVTDAANKRMEAGTGSDADRQFMQDANSVQNLALNDYVANVTANTKGASFNPDNELVLNGIGLRTHSFEFMLTPKNAKEKEDVKKAIKTLKSAMLPTKIAATENSSIALGYPYEFSIFFMDGRDATKGQPLDIPPIPDCALTDVSVTYNPTSMKFHKDGSPVQYRLSLSFKEHQTLTREDLEEGNF